MSFSAITSSSISLANEFPASNLDKTAFDNNFLANSLSKNSVSEAEQVVNQLDHLFGYRKGLNMDQEKQVNYLFDQIDTLLIANAGNTPSAEDQNQLDKLFDQIDQIYQARSYESLSSKEQKMADRLLDQLDMALA